MAETSLHVGRRSLCPARHDLRSGKQAWLAGFTRQATHYGPTVMHVQQLLVSLSRILRILSALGKILPNLGEKGSCARRHPGRFMATLPHARGQHGGNRTRPAPGRHPSPQVQATFRPLPRRSASPGYAAQTSRNGIRSVLEAENGSCIIVLFASLPPMEPNGKVRGIHQLAGGLDAPI
jgi:hypothetical protein